MSDDVKAPESAPTEANNPLLDQARELAISANPQLAEEPEFSFDDVPSDSTPVETTEVPAEAEVEAAEVVEVADEVPAETPAEDPRLDKITSEFERRFEALAAQEKQIREQRKQMEDMRRHYERIDQDPLSYLAEKGIGPDQIIDAYLDSGESKSEGSVDPIQSTAEHLAKEFAAGKITAEQMAERLNETQLESRHVTAKDVQQLMQMQLQQQAAQQAQQAYKSQLESVVRSEDYKLFEVFHQGENVADVLYQKADAHYRTTGEILQPEQIAKQELERYKKITESLGTAAPKESKPQTKKVAPSNGLSNTMDTGLDMDDAELEEFVTMSPHERDAYAKQLFDKISKKVGK